MSQVQFIVDDRDPRIIPTSGIWGKWHGNYANYNSTTSAIGSGSGSFSFKFNGTNFAVFAHLLAISDLNRDTPPIITCSVDGQSMSVATPTVGPDQYHFEHCKGSVADDREHTLVVNIRCPTTAWYFDYITYGAVISKDHVAWPDDTPVHILVDDTDSRFVYSDAQAWFNIGTSRDYGGTTHSTKTVGAAATFSFFGSAVKIYGSFDPQPSGASSTYALTTDDIALKSFTAPGRDTTLYQTQLVNFTSLEEKDHALDIACVNPNGGDYVLDFAVYSTKPSSLLRTLDTPDANTTSAATNTQPTSTGGTGGSISFTGSPTTNKTQNQDPEGSNIGSDSGSVPIGTGGSISHTGDPVTSRTQTPGAETSNIGSNSSSIPIGIIIGPVVASSVLLVVLALVLYARIRMNNRRRREVAKLADEPDKSSDSDNEDEDDTIGSSMVPTSALEAATNAPPPAYSRFSSSSSVALSS